MHKCFLQSPLLHLSLYYVDPKSILDTMSTIGTLYQSGQKLSICGLRATNMRLFLDV